MATHFGQATVVFVGRTTTTTPADDPTGFRSVRFEIIGSPYKGEPGALRYLTGDSSASCGIDVTPGIVYVAFAAIDPDEPEVAYVTTCNGTRSIDPETPSNGEGFMDVPAERVLPALFALSQAHEAATLPIGGVAKPHSIIGLVELPAVFDRDRDEAAINVDFEAALVRDAPRTDATVIAKIESESDVITREVAYELDGAVVYEQRDNWLRLSLADGRTGWLDSPVSASFHPLEELLVNRLSYLTPAWDGRLWPQPGAGHPFRPSIPDHIREEPPIRVVETTRVAGSLWLNVQVYGANLCSAAEGETRPIAGGWIPAWNADGEVTSWYWARGC